MRDIVRYFGKSFEIPYIERDSYIPVGGTSQYTNETDIKVLVDSSRLEPLIQEMRDNASKYDRSKLKAWLQSGNIDIDENLFATLYAFTNVYTQRVGFNPDSAKRRELYHNDSQRLSEVINRNAAECAEIAALAQLYLQEERIDSTYFSGEVLGSKSWEFAEAHTFIPLKFNGREYIFDPANPHKASCADGTETLIPRIQKVENFRDKVGQGKKAYIETTSVLNQSQVWYGVGNGTEVSESDLF